MEYIQLMNLASVDLNLLVAFDALLTERNVTRAGAAVGLSQPAMSNALSRLRALFDDPLFVRNAGRMEPTARAATLAEPVRSALLQLQAALEAAGPFDPATARRRFVLASADYTELLLLPPLVARLRAAAPHIDIAFREANRLNARAVLEAGEADLVLVPFTEGLTDLRSAAVLREGFVTIARRGHPAFGKRLTLKRFLELPHVLVSVEGEGTSLLDNVLAARGLKRRIAVSVPHFTAAPFVVATSDAIATVPARVAQRLARVTGLAIHNPPLTIEGFTLHAIWHRRHDADPAHRWLRDQIMQAARNA